MLSRIQTQACSVYTVNVMNADTDGYGFMRARLVCLSRGLKSGMVLLPQSLLPQVHSRCMSLSTGPSSGSSCGIAITQCPCRHSLCPCFSRRAVAQCEQGVF